MTARTVTLREVGSVAWRERLIITVAYLAFAAMSVDAWLVVALVAGIVIGEMD